ncbi:hypothetical protein MMC20_005062 [Loxospora ochrophaea]|nr:hypothetical protein [Loxospora ochrophaea]
MASVAHCLYCFEVLAASFNKRDALTLAEVEDLWSQYQAKTKPETVDDSEMTEASDNDPEPEENIEEEEDDEDDEEEEDEEEEALEPPSIPSSLQPPSISRLQAPSPASASTSSTPSTVSSSSSRLAPSSTSSKSSGSSFFSFGRRTPSHKEPEYPLFITWNTISKRGHKSLRGCIGTFEPHDLASGLKSYALTSAFDDTRFSPVSRSELSSLSNSITLLRSFTPCAHPLDWDLGTHGLRISFSSGGRRLGATYLPDVAVEQGWSKEETIVSLMRKAGWTGRSSEWRKVEDLRAVKYQGSRANVDWDVWNEWRRWVEGGR